MSRSRSSSVSASPPEPHGAGAAGRLRPDGAGKALLFLLASLSLGAGPMQPQIVPPHCPEAQKICTDVFARNRNLKTVEEFVRKVFEQLHPKT